MRKRAAPLATVALATSLAACGGEVPAPPPATPGSDVTTPSDPVSNSTPPPTDPVSVLAAEDLVTASNSLGTLLLVADPDAVNAIVSPASLTLALSSLGAGVTNEAAAQFDAIFGAHGAPLLETARELAATISQFDGEPVVDTTEPPEVPLVHIADHLVLDDQLQPVQDYLDLLQEVGGAELSLTDLASPEAKDLLDEWVNLHTGGLIERSAIVPTEDSRLVIQNAVLFSARWQSEFAEEGTSPQPFHRLDGSAVSTDMMHATLYVAYVEQDGWTAISLPYTEGFTTYVILPPDGVDPMGEGREAVDQRIRSLEAALSGAHTEETAIALPVLDLASDLELKDALDEAGLSEIFSPTGSPLAGISAAEDLYVSQVAQQGVLVVNEAGTTAAAVTEIGMDVAAAPGNDPLVFEADRPFLLTVTHQETGWDLFQAVVRDPTAE